MIDVHRWQRGTSNKKPVWVALGPDGTRIKNEGGAYLVRYDNLPGAVYYWSRSGTLDKTASPEQLPAGWEADSPEGIIVRFCFTDEARRDWIFLDAWKRRRNTSLAHAGCGDSWPQVPLRLPLQCPVCGPLRGDDSVYAQWHTVKDPDSESVKVAVLEAWLNGKRHDYLAGKRPAPQPAGGTSKTRASAPAVRTTAAEVQPEPAAAAEPSPTHSPSGARLGAAVGAALVIAMVVWFALGL